MWAIGYGGGSRRQWQPRNELDTGLAQAEAYASSKVSRHGNKNARELRLVERKVLEAGVRGSNMSLLDDMLHESRDPASSDISPVLAQNRHMVGTLYTRSDN